MHDVRRGFRNLGLGLLIGGLWACGGQQTAKTGIDFNSMGFEGLDSMHFDILSNTCSISGSTATIIVADGEFAYVFYRSTDSNVVVNAYNASGTECIFPSSDKIVVQAAAGGASNGTHKILFDFLSGSFAMGTSGSPNGIAITFATGATNTVEIRGTNSADLFNFGTSSGTSYASYAFGASSHAWTDMSMSGVTNILVSTGPGDDVITGQGMTSPALSPLSGSISMTVYGGDGNDIITSGAAGSGVNSLYGNAGSDRFPQVTALAHDIISGGTDPTYTYSTTATGTATGTSTSTSTTHLTGTGTGTSTAVRTLTTTTTVTNTVTNTTTYTQTDISVDVVDYSARASAVRVTLGDDLLAVKASGMITCVAPAAISDHHGFTLKDKDGNTLQSYEYRNSVDAVTTGTIVAPLQSVLADHDTFTINDGVKTAVFEIIVNHATTPNSSDPNLVADVSGATTAPEVATIMAAAIGAYRDSNADHTQTLNVTYAVSTDTITVTNVNPDVVPSFITQSASKFTIVNTPGVHWVPTGSALPINVHGLTGGTAAVAAVTADAITAGSSTVTAIASGSVVTVTANTAGAATNFTMIKDGGTFTIVNMFTGVDAAGANDGDFTNYLSEGDSIGADVENVIGTSTNDYIDASAAYLTSHVLQGMSGDDTLIIGVSSTVSNTLYGGPGNDILQGGSGVDTLYGGDGNDSLRGGPGNDIIDGGNVNCLVASSAVAASGATPPKPAIYTSALCTSTYAAAGSSGSTNTPGKDTLDYSDRTAAVVVDMTTLASPTSGTQIGVTGEQDIVTNCVYLRGGSGNDTLTGDANPNMIWGGPGNDTISGGGGNDTLYGEAGNDTISGNAGDDYIYGGTGVNTLYGDTHNDMSVIGNDLIDDSQGSAGSVIDCGPGDMDVLIPNTGGETVTACEL